MISSTSLLDAAPRVIARGRVRVGIHVTTWDRDMQTHIQAHTLSHAGDVSTIDRLNVDIGTAVTSVSKRADDDSDGQTL